MQSTQGRGRCKGNHCSFALCTPLRIRNEVSVRRVPWDKRSKCGGEQWRTDGDVTKRELDLLDGRSSCKNGLISEINRFVQIISFKGTPFLFNALGLSCGSLFDEVDREGDDESEG